MASAAAGVEDLDWEEWDASSSPLSFFDHCLAGSFAGVMEHTLLYPLDTVKTCWQSQVLSKAASSSSGGSGVAGCSLVGGGNGGMMSGVRKGLTTNTTTLASTSSLGNSGIGLGGTTTQQYPQMMQSSSQSSLNTIQSSHGIWSTMKHLMNQGGGGAQSQSQYHPITQLVKAQMVTMAQQHHAPNVVDLTDISTKSSAARNSSGSSSPRRPWSQHGRAIRGATISDITSSGAIRSSSFALPLSSSSSSTATATGIANITMLGERAGES